MNVRQVGQELGVRYVVEGSVRKVSDRVRITAQLVDAATESHLWAERYDRDLKDIYAVQDEVTQKILAALAVRLRVAEKGDRVRSSPENVDSYDHFLRGIDYYRRHTKETNRQARRMFKKAIELNPTFPRAYTWLGWTHFEDWALQWSDDPGSLERAFDLAEGAINLDPSQAPFSAFAEPRLSLEETARAGHRCGGEGHSFGPEQCG